MTSLRRSGRAIKKPERYHVDEKPRVRMLDKTNDKYSELYVEKMVVGSNGKFQPKPAFMHFKCILSKLKAGWRNEEEFVKQVKKMSLKKNIAMDLNNMRKSLIGDKVTVRPLEENPKELGIYAETYIKPGTQLEDLWGVVRLKGIGSNNMAFHEKYHKTTKKTSQIGGMEGPIYFINHSKTPNVKWMSKKCDGTNEGKNRVINFVETILPMDCRIKPEPKNLSTIP